MFSKFSIWGSGGFFPQKASLHFQRRFKNQVLTIRRFANESNEFRDEKQKRSETGWKWYGKFFVNLFRSNANPDSVDREGMRKTAFGLGIIMALGGYYLYSNADAQQNPGEIFKFPVKDIDGNPFDLNQYKGQTLVIVAPCSS